MRLRQWGAVSGVAISALVAAGLTSPAQAQSGSSAAVSAADPAAVQASRPDSLPNPLGDAAAATRQEALKALLTGKATTKVINGNRVIELPGAAKSNNGNNGNNGNGQKTRRQKSKYVNYPVNREESIFTILTDFGTQIHPVTGGTAGPVHNEIAEPDRTWDGNVTDDNSTYWTADFNRSHYMDMMFGEGESFKNFYLKQSNGRFLAKGDVSDWVTVPYNESRYGSNAISDASAYWPYIRDTAAAWYNAQVAAGKTKAEITDYLKQFDQVDRYDYDGDGDFNEPDGYIDHFQAIHAGEGEEAGGGAQGEDAIWSHRWYAYSTNEGKTGPDFNLLGGVPLGDSGIWIGDYTTEPENGGLGVFAHEFGHDLGLPDLYDTAGGDNGTGFWTLMSAGSWLNHGGDAIGTTPGYMGPWEKWQLGWLDYKVVPYGKNTTVDLGPANKASKKDAQALIVPLPERTVVTQHNTPFSGSGEWWSGLGNDLSNTLTRTIDLTGATNATVTAKLMGNLEEDYDYLYPEVSTNGGTTWTQVGTPFNGDYAKWTSVSVDLQAYVGSSVQFRFRLATDGGVASEAFLDDIALVTDGPGAFSDDVESGAGAWTAKGFTIINGTTSRQVQDVYFAENRVYSDYDKTLQTGPYNFGDISTKPNWVERFPYQNGMLVWFSNGEFADNNTTAHPGGGLILPVDARPAPVMLKNANGTTTLLGNRRQPFDATFGLERTDAVTFHRNSVPTTVASSAAIPTFDDRNPNAYWSAGNPLGSTLVAGSGTTMTVTKSRERGNVLEVKVAFKK